MDGLTVALFFIGLALLIVGAEMLVRGASSLARRVGLSPLVIGLTVVAYGTSSPELAVSTGAALSGEGSLGLGNIIGSNIFNVLFILGLSAAIAPLIVSQQLIRLDVPIMIGISILLMLFAWNGALSRYEGLILLAGAVLYTVFAIRQSRRESREISEEYDEAFGAPQRGRGWLESLPMQIVLIVVGLAALVLGATWLVDGAIEAAETIGISEVVIGLTIVAAGTSLPEVATSIIAAFRGERDIAVGNIVGSNIANILVILGLTTTLSPNALEVAPSLINFDLPVMTAVAVACLPIFFTGRLIGRWEGALFLGYYVAYTMYLVLDATEHDALGAYSSIMLIFVVPITALTLIAVTIQALRGGKQPANGQ